MEKESFILYNSFYESIKSLKNEQLGKLLRAIFDYTINGEITQDNEILIAFMFIKNQIDIDTKKWEQEKHNRSEAGKKGMASRWGNKNNKDNNVITNDNKDNNVINVITNITDNVNVNDNVNENDNVNVNVNNIYEFIEENFGRTLSPIEYEKISMWEDNELTRHAIKEAVLNGAYSFKYIDTILDNYKKNNILTVQQAQEQEKKFKDNQNKYKGLSFKEQENLRQQELLDKWVNGEV